MTYYILKMNNTNCPLGKYSESLGIPNEGVHSYRLFDVAIVDVIMTIVASGFISFVFKFNFIIILILLFVLGIILHRLFCVNTTINKLIFGKIRFKKQKTN